MLRQIFGVPEGDPSEIELQLTISDDGDYFKIHTDTQRGSPTKSRLVTFVYYFSSDQATFTGGDLILYDSPMCAPNLVASTHHVIPPTRNSIVFFRSTAWHEVTPIANRSGQFGDGRFTINGWLHWSSINPDRKTP
jgi:Rps23 Pro-64 3,4-dihydroxylase Tpa1-like proline 4-hydroxylase